MFSKASYSYVYDEVYRSVALENAVQVIPGVRNLGSFAVCNTSGAVLWLALWDAAPGNPAAGPGPLLNDNRPIELVPVAGPGWFQVSVHGGTDLINGLWAGLYSTAALALAGNMPDGGAVAWYKCEFRASTVIPQV